MAQSKPINVRLPQELADSFNLFIQGKGWNATRGMELAVSMMLGSGNHAKFSPPSPTESQRAGMRSRALMLLQTGREYSPEELGRLMGCGENAASAYCRDLRKGKYGRHSIVSRQDVANGKRVSFYRLVRGEDEL